MVWDVPVAPLSFFASLKEYVGFDETSSRRLRALLPVARPHFPALVDDFYDAIRRHEHARAAIRGGDAQVERLKQTLADWLELLLAGPHDDVYFEKRARIGRVHVRIELPQSFMFTAMNRLRGRLDEIARAHVANTPGADQEILAALHQILDLELAIMLETYREDLLTRSREFERLSTIGQLAAGIGHELRNPLGVVESSVFLLRQQLATLGVQHPKLTRHLDRITGEVRRSNKTITDLLDLARNRPPQSKLTSVTSLADHAVAGLQLPEEIVLHRSIPDELQVFCDASQIVTVLANLLLNAAQALAGRGPVFVSAETDGAGVRIRVRDEGPGVPREVHHRIFDPLFTTKPRGSGLGLALCRRIVEAHGGTIDLEPTESGACFAVFLPGAPTQGTPS